VTPAEKKALSERDICTKFVTPAIVAAGWDLMQQIREQVYFTKGRVIVRGETIKRGDPKFADDVLYHKPPAKCSSPRQCSTSLDPGRRQL
jgi:type I restriction enzyme R subunit